MPPPPASARAPPAFLNPRVFSSREATNVIGTLTVFGPCHPAAQYLQRLSQWRPYYCSEKARGPEWVVSYPAEKQLAKRIAHTSPSRGAFTLFGISSWACPLGSRPKCLWSWSQPCQGSYPAMDFPAHAQGTRRSCGPAGPKV